MSFCAQIEDSSYWFQHRNSAILSLISKWFINKQNSFLDIGGGNGFQAKAIQDLGIDTWLVEPGPKGAKKAKDRGVRNCICATLNDLQLADDSISGASAFDVVEHIEDQDAFLKEVHRVLEPSGLFFMTVPALSLLWSSEDVHAGHYRRYTRKSARKALKKAGFQIVDDGYLFSPLCLPILLFRTLPTVLGFSKPTTLDGAQQDHSLPNNLAGRWIGKRLERESKILQSGKSMLLGSSVYIVGRKN